MWHRWLVVAVGLLLLSTTAALAQQPAERPLIPGEGRWSFATSVNYTVGDYGTGRDTEILYVPFTLGVTPIDRLWLYLTVPYIRQTTQDVVVTGAGVAGRRKTTTAAPSTEEGVGDVLLKASLLLVKEEAQVPEIAPFVRIKFPTADEDRGLGTGEFDETVGVDLAKRLVEDLFGYLTLSYTFIGDPPHQDLNDSFGWSVGAAYTVLPPLSVFGFLEGWTNIAPGQDDAVQLRGGAEFRLTRALSVTGAVIRGLTDGAPDWGISAGATLRF